MVYLLFGQKNINFLVCKFVIYDHYAKNGTHFVQCYKLKVRDLLESAARNPPSLYQQKNQAVHSLSQFVLTDQAFVVA